MIAVAPRLNDWPILVAAMICAGMIAVSMAPLLETAQHNRPDVIHAPEPEPDEPPAPGVATLPPHAPAPGRDDRTLIEYASQVFGLRDSDFAAKLSGVGPVFWAMSHGTGALIAPDVVLTTAHLFVSKGNWTGANGAVPVPPPPSKGSIHIASCGRSYQFSSIEVGIEAPRSRLGLDYAIARLTQPACAEAAILPVMKTPEDLAMLKAEDTAVLEAGAYPFAEIPRFVNHPLFAGRKPHKNVMERFHVFASKCTATGFRNTGDVAAGSTGLIETEGCDGLPGSSGGPLIATFGGKADYRIIGVGNSYRPNTEYNNHTKIEGAFAAHVARHVGLIAATAKSSGPAEKTPADPQGGGGWRPRIAAQPNIDLLMVRALPRKACLAALEAARRRTAAF